MAFEPSGSQEWVTIAVVVCPRGNRGEVVAAPQTGRLDRFERVSRVYLFGADPGQAPVPCEVESAWVHRGRVVLKFRGVDSISAAEELRGCEVRIPRQEREPLPEGEYYESDLVGFQVLDRRTGRTLGRVTGWRHYGGPPLLEVDGAGGKRIEIPFARSICVGIDMDSRKIVVELPEGLEDLNG